MTQTAAPVVFLDRDGTLNRNFEDGPVYQIERFELLPRAAEAVRMLNDLKIPVYLLSNQGGIRHKERDFDLERYQAIEAKMTALLEEQAGAQLNAIYICPHAVYENCSCRKPETGLFEQAYREQPFDIASSYTVGDSSADIVAGKAFGVRTILVTSGWQDGVLDKLIDLGHRPDHVAADVYEAALLIREELAGGAKP